VQTIPCCPACEGFGAVPRDDDPAHDTCPGCDGTGIAPLPIGEATELEVVDSEPAPLIDEPADPWQPERNLSPWRRQQREDFLRAMRQGRLRGLPTIFGDLP
jgi:hypothetical protein